MTIRRVTLWLCDDCLKKGKYNECITFGCAMWRAHEASLWDRFPVEIEGFVWEGCPVCHIADDGGWAVRHDVDVFNCKKCSGTGLVRVENENATRYRCSSL